MGLESEPNCKGSDKPVALYLHAVLSEGKAPDLKHKGENKDLCGIAPF